MLDPGYQMQAGGGIIRMMWDLSVTHLVVRVWPDRNVELPRALCVARKAVTSEH
jgi:hypothetical protein